MTWLKAMHTHILSILTPQLLCQKGQSLRELRQTWNSNPVLFASKHNVLSAAFTPSLARNANTQQRGGVPLPGSPPLPGPF